MLADKNKCTGCSACYNICPQNAITMEYDECGFLYPVIKESECVGCNKCMATCPVLDRRKSYNQPIAVYACQHISDEVLEKSTSGGMFTALSDYILSEKGVVYGAIHDEKMYTRHVRIDNKYGRDKMCGAKYVQSEIGKIYCEVLLDLKAGRKVLFTGTPCQIDGLKHFLPKSLTKEKLFLVDLICAGVPSQKVFLDYIRYYEKKEKKKIIEHIHRSKKKGWGPHIEVTIFQDGTEEWKSEISQGWVNMFHSASYNRKSCYNCQYVTTDRVSDITIGDFWKHDDAGITLSYERGLSLVLINTDKGHYIFNMVKKSLITEKSTLEKALIGQPRLRNVPCDCLDAEAAWREYFDKGSDAVMRKYADFNLVLWIKRQGKKMLTKLKIK